MVRLGWRPTYRVVKALNDKGRGLDVRSGVARKHALPTLTRLGTVRVDARHLHVVDAAEEI